MQNKSAQSLLLSFAGAGPVSAMIEVADRCNESCGHCYQVQGQKGEMSTAEVFRVLKGLASLGVMRLTVSGGEATLRPDLLPILERARDHGFMVTLYTNGITMTAELAAELYRLALSAVEVSLYSHDPAIHDSVTGVPGSFGRTVAGITRLVAAGVHVVVKTPVMIVNEHDLPAYEAFVARLGASCQLGHGRLFTREDGDASGMALSPSLQAARPERHRGPRDMSAPSCAAGRGVHVEPNGRMSPCTMLDVDLGDARSTDLTEREEVTAVRDIKALTWGDIHGCRDCALVALCTHCYAHALDEVGDALAPYPSACALGRAAYFGGQADPGEAAFTGPYRVTVAGRLEAANHNVTFADDALAARMPWIRGAPRSTDLVTLRLKPA